MFPQSIVIMLWLGARWLNKFVFIQEITLLGTSWWFLNELCVFSLSKLFEVEAADQVMHDQLLDLIREEESNLVDLKTVPHNEILVTFILLHVFVEAVLGAAKMILVLWLGLLFRHALQEALLRPLDHFVLAVLDCWDDCHRVVFFKVEKVFHRRIVTVHVARRRLHLIVWLQVLAGCLSYCVLNLLVVEDVPGEQSFKPIKQLFVVVFCLLMLVLDTDLKKLQEALVVVH